MCNFTVDSWVRNNGDSSGAVSTDMQFARCSPRRYWQWKIGAVGRASRHLGTSNTD
jgi:hypothetical protein